MSKFGNNYPAGAQNDPRAPWNQRDLPDVDLEDPMVGEHEECPHCGSVAYWVEDQLFTGWYCTKCDWEQEAAAEDFNQEDQSLKR